MKKKVCISIYEKDGQFYWTVSKELTGNDDDASCGPFDDMKEAMTDLNCFLDDSDAWNN
jgi:hypothetical protein